MSPGTAKQILERALWKLRDNDLKSFPKTIGERPIMGRIALYAVEAGAEGDGLTVDCDYNRHLDEVKKFLRPKQGPLAGVNEKRFFPDIVLHHRCDDSRNVLVCEIKRKGDHRGSEVDHERLTDLTRPKRDQGQFGYEVGAFIEVDTPDRTVKIKYFAKGAPESSRTWDIVIPNS